MATFESIQTGNIHIDEGERNIKDLSPLAKDRIAYKPRYPSCFEDPEKLNVLHLPCCFYTRWRSTTTRRLRISTVLSWKTISPTLSSSRS